MPSPRPYGRWAVHDAPPRPGPARAPPEVPSPDASGGNLTLSAADHFVGREGVDAKKVPLLSAQGKV
jgi:hypothetical protein